MEILNSSLTCILQKTYKQIAKLSLQLVFFLTDEGKMVEVESDLKKKCKIFGDGRRWRGDWPLFIGPLTSPGAHQQAPNRQKQNNFKIMKMQNSKIMIFRKWYCKKEFD